MLIRGMGVFWKHAERLGALSALLLAIPAFTLAWYSWSTSRRALELSERDYQAARTLILRADYYSETGNVRLKPVEESVTLQTCKVIFPSSLSGSYLVMPPDFEID